MNLKLFLDQNRVWYRFIEKPKTIHTADAAKVAGVDLNRLTKSLILLDGSNQPVLAIIPGNCRLDIKKLAVLLHLTGLKLVPFDQAENYSGYLPGATPPVGHKQPMRAAIDQQLLKFPTIFGGGGERNLLVELKTGDVVKLNQAISGDISLC